MKWLIRIGTHLAAAGIGFGLGIYLLPILIAPESPGEQEVQSVADSSQFTAEVRRDLEDSDAELVFTLTANTNPGLFAATPIDPVAGTLDLVYAANANGSADLTLRATDKDGAEVETCTCDQGGSQALCSAPISAWRSTNAAKRGWRPSVALSPTCQSQHRARVNATVSRRVSLTKPSSPSSLLRTQLTAMASFSRP